MTNLELRNKFKYKSFKLSANNSILKFELDQVLTNGVKVCAYQVKYAKGDCKMTFDPSHFGPFLNIEVQLADGESFLLNPEPSKFRGSQKITLTEIPNG